jgi:LPXTG-motif cell wall-anchored protein
MQTSQAQAAAANAKSDNTVYLFAGGAALLALFYFLSRRK